MGKSNFLTLVELLTPNGQSMIDDVNDALRMNLVTSVTLGTQQVSGASDSVQAKAIAMTTNPSAVADADAAFLRSDKIGRLVTTPVQVRDLRTTAYATLNTNTETTLLAGVASTFLDLVYVSFANTSTATVNIDLRDGTGQNISQTFAIPANTTQGVSYSVPIPQGVAADTWTVDFNTADVSNTTVYVNGLFARNI